MTQVLNELNRLNRLIFISKDNVKWAYTPPDPNSIIASEEEYVESTSTTKVPTVSQVKTDMKIVNDKLNMLSNNYTLLSSETIINNGEYPLSQSSDNYDLLVATFRSKFSTIKDTSSVQNNYEKYSIVPVLEANSSEDYNVTYSSIYPGFLAYRSFTSINASYWVSNANSSNNSWLAIENVKSTFKTNMFTVKSYNPSFPGRQPKKLQIQGSNDGTTWDVLVNDTTAFASSEISRNYVLDDYVEYKHIRVFFPATQNTTYGLLEVNQFFIQDTKYHYGNTRNDISSISSVINDINYGTLTFIDNVVNVSLNSTYQLADIIGLQFNKVIKLPLGSMLYWVLPTIPVGYLKADGSPVPAEYPVLQAIYPDGLPNVPNHIVYTAVE